MRWYIKARMFEGVWADTAVLSDDTVKLESSKVYGLSQLFYQMVQ